jgi:hypothetical protein
MTRTPVDPKYRWTNFPNAPRPRKPLRSSAEGTLANIGRIAHEPRVVGGADLGVTGLRPRIRRESVDPQAWRTYVPRHQGPIVRRVHELKPPPNCIHCGGPTKLGRRSTFHCHVDKVETLWACINPTCLGQLDAAIFVSPIGRYERRC